MSAESVAERFGRFPIMKGPSVPWEVMVPHEQQALKNHGQSLETLASRGGLDCAEAWYVVNGERGDWSESAIAHAKASWVKFAAETNRRYERQARRIAELESALDGLAQAVTNWSADRERLPMRPSAQRRIFDQLGAAQAVLKREHAD